MEREAESEMMSLEFYNKIKDWLVTNKDGEWIGIRDDAPDDAKKAWNEMESDEKEGLIW